MKTLATAVLFLSAFLVSSTDNAFAATHIVSKGENLWTIAKSEKVGFSAIKAANKHLASRKISAKLARISKDGYQWIFPGDKIEIPKNVPAATAALAGSQQIFPATADYAAEMKKAITETIPALEEQISKVSQENNSLSDEVAALKREIGNLKAEIDSLDKKSVGADPQTEPVPSAPSPPTAKRKSTGEIVVEAKKVLADARALADIGGLSSSTLFIIRWMGISITAALFFTFLEIKRRKKRRRRLRMYHPR